jgi:ABC-type antimicrobial peptide transport system permease subunit
MGVEQQRPHLVKLIDKTATQVLQGSSCSFSRMVESLPILRYLKSLVPFFRWQVYICRHFLQHTFHDIRKNKVNFLLGFFACFLVVFVVSLVVSIIGNTPVVFLRLAELEVGEMDMEIRAAMWSRDYFLNYSAVENILSKETEYSYHSPRYKFSFYATAAKECPGLDPFDPYWKYHPNNSREYCSATCFYSLCSAAEYQATAYVIDTKREAHMQLGREWVNEPLGIGYIYMQNSLANEMGVIPGDIIYVTFNMINVIPSIWSHAILAGFYSGSAYQVFFSAAPVYLPFIIKNSFGSSNGKFGSGEQAGVIIEYSTFMEYIVKNIDPNLSQGTKNYLNSTNLYYNAQSIIFNLPPPRVPIYINSNQDVITASVVQWASQILYRIGYNVVSTNLTILSQLSSSSIISLFLGLILSIIIYMLLFLSIILIYSLMMIIVDTKTFEMGVLRMIGITRYGLVLLLLFQAFSYSVPSWAIGLLTAQLFGVIVANWFENLTGVHISPTLTSDAILMATWISLLVSIVASVLPIRNALGKNLHDSLDSNRSKTKAVQVNIERAEDSNISVPVIIIGIALTTFGFGIYYVFPLSLLSMNFGLLLNMFCFLLIGMLFGLVLLSLNVGQMLETLIVTIFFWWENTAISQVTLKNLVAHRIRNRKTAIMYALSLGFIIFINVTYQMQESSMTYQIQQEEGAYIKVVAGKIPSAVCATLEDIAFRTPSVAGFAWVSVPFPVDQSISQQVIANIGHLYRDVANVYAVSPNFFEIAIPGYLNIHEVVHDGDIKLDSENQLAYQLYSEEGSKSLIIGARYESYLGLSIPKSHMLLETSYTTGESSRVRLKPMGFLDSAPFFTFSEFPSVSSQSVLVSFTTYTRLSRVYKSVEDIPMSNFFIKMANNATDADKDALITRLKLVSSAKVFDYRTVESPLATASVVIQYFFQFTTVVAMLVSFFSLMSSMFTNIHEQAKEIGILRAIGISKGALYRIYVYEAFVLVLASSLLGILIGTVVGYMVLLQRFLFTQLPIPFVIPTQLLIVVFVCSILFGALAAFGPIKRVLSNPVVNIIRGVT